MTAKKTRSIGQICLQGQSTEHRCPLELSPSYSLTRVSLTVCCVYKKSSRDVVMTSLLPADLVSPEGLAVDAKRRKMFWVDSNQDLIETANLDGSGRRTLFDTDLVNPRAIIVVSSTG